MKNTYRFRRTIGLLQVLLITQLVFSQVNVSLNVLPPYSPYFRDYAGYADNKTVVTLLYSAIPGSAPIQVFLAGSLHRDDGSIRVALKENNRPAIPLTLSPNVPRTLTGASLRDIFGNASANALTLEGITKEALSRNQAFPEGNYTLCIKALNYNTGQLISQDCRSLYILHAEPPQITAFAGNEIEARIPQYVNLGWTPVTPFAQGTSYRLRLVKVPEGVNPFDALNYSTQVILEKSNLVLPNFPLDIASGVKLEANAVYAAQVIATAPSVYIKNNGKSEPMFFKYKENKETHARQQAQDFNTTRSNRQNSNYQAGMGTNSNNPKDSTAGSTNGSTKMGAANINTSRSNIKQQRVQQPNDTTPTRHEAQDFNTTRSNRQNSNYQAGMGTNSNNNPDSIGNGSTKMGAANINTSRSNIKQQRVQQPNDITPTRHEAQDFNTTRSNRQNSNYQAGMGTNSNNNPDSIGNSSTKMGAANINTSRSNIKQQRVQQPNDTTPTRHEAQDFNTTRSNRQNSNYQAGMGTNSNNPKDSTAGSTNGSTKMGAANINTSRSNIKR